MLWVTNLKPAEHRRTTDYKINMCLYYIHASYAKQVFGKENYYALCTMNAVQYRIIFDCAAAIHNVMYILLYSNVSLSYPHMLKLGL
jgi:hypothetical protein